MQLEHLVALPISLLCRTTQNENPPVVVPAVLLKVGESPEEVVALRANESGVLKSKRCTG